MNKIEFSTRRPVYFVGMAYDEEYDLLLTATNEGTVEVKSTKS